MTVPDAPELNHTYYDELLGADYSCDPTECDRRRSPDMLNMISDNGGNPVKRLGWRIKYSLGSGHKILKIYIDDNGVIFAIAQDGVYRIKDNKSSKIIDKQIQKAELVKFQGKMYAFANGIYEIDGDVKDLMDDPYIPETTISRKPDGTGGTFLDSINLLTPKRKVSFLGDDSSKKYNFVPEKDQEDDKYKYVVADSIKVEVQDENGIFKENTDFTKPETTTVTGKNVNGEIVSFTVCAPYITFSAVHKPIVVGQDNVRITYENFDATEEDGVMIGQYKEERQKLLNTGIVKTHGYVASDRLFCVVGDNRVYYSDVGKPAYFPDDNYIEVGNAGRIVGLHRFSSYLVAIKNEISVESTVYLIEGNTLDGDTFFGVSPAIGGTGAVAEGSFSTLIDEPLFLSRTGIYAISSSYLTSEKILRNRSFFIDKKLAAEENLETAVACVWNRYYILVVNGHAYVLDGRKKSTEKKNNTDYAYEGYYWENIPAACLFTHNNELWFGTEDGEICKFNTDVIGITAYCDKGNESIDGDGVLTLTGGEVISCRWTTPLDDDKTPQYFKTLNKKGNVLDLIPYDRSSVNVYYSKDGEPRVYLGTGYVDIFNWKEIDFSRFTFNSNDSVQDMYTRKKIKKYKRLQFIFENNAIYEPFGIISFVKTYSVGNFAK